MTITIAIKNFFIFQIMCEEWSDIAEAVSQGNFEEVKRLIEVEGVDIDEMVKHDKTPLAIAMYQDEYEIAKYLLEHGANPLLPNEYYEFPFSWETEEKITNYARKLMLEEVEKEMDKEKK